MTGQASSHPSTSTNPPPPIIAWAPVFDEKGFVTTGEHITCPFRCKIEFEFVEALLSHLERHHTQNRHRDLERDDDSVFACRWPGCDYSTDFFNSKGGAEHIERHLKASLLGTLPFGSRVSCSPSPSSSSPASDERSKSYSSLFGRTPSPSAVPSSEKSYQTENLLRNRIGTENLTGGELDTVEVLGGGNSDTERDNGPQQSPSVVRGRDDDEDEEDENEIEELLKLEPDNDTTLSTNIRATAPSLNPTASNPDSTSVPTPSITPAPILGHAGPVMPPERVRYKQKITHPMGKFKHRVDLDPDEPIPKFEYSLMQKGRLNGHIIVTAMKRKHEEIDGE